MMTKEAILERMSFLCPETDQDELLRLTRRLIDHRVEPGAEKIRFESTKHRGILNFHDALLPQEWETVLVTGGTGCVGTVVLTRLAQDLPGARLFSVSRHAPEEAERRVGQVEYLIGDVRDTHRMSEIMQDIRPDVVVHLAAQRDPSYAEDHVAETVSTNVLGSRVVFDAAGEAEVPLVIVASTGKTVRLFTSDVYAATKKLMEYQAALAAARYGYKIVCARFTHVTGNSIVGSRIQNWIENNEPIRLHSSSVLLPIQSALECYQLLMAGGMDAEIGIASIVALRDLGWPPINLLDMTLDHLAESPSSSSPIVFTGYPSGYEAFAYPGTYDPLTAGDVSPLINCLEAASTMPVKQLEAVDRFLIPERHSDQLDADLLVLNAMSNSHQRQREMQTARLLGVASSSLLHHTLSQASIEQVVRIHKLGKRYDQALADHHFIHNQIEFFLPD